MFFFFNDTATTEIYTLSLHDALPISQHAARGQGEAVHEVAFLGAGLELDHHHGWRGRQVVGADHLHHALGQRSEEHTSELQSPCNLVCRLLLEKKQKNKRSNRTLTTD